VFLAVTGMLMGVGVRDSVGDWYSGNWPYRQEVTILSTMVPNTDQTNFPVVIAITNANDLFAQAQVDGDDILFTSSNGTTKLSHEIEMYDPTTTQLWAWVKVPTLSASQSTVLYMYYGNPSSADEQGATGVWDSDYKLVVHMSETGTLTRADSTAYGNHGMTNGYEGDEAFAGKIDGADSLNPDGDTSDDYLLCGSDSSLNITSTVTVEAWIRMRDVSGSAYRGILSKYWRYMLYIDADERVTFHAAACESAIINTAQWYYAVGTYDKDAGADNVKLYLDGVLANQITDPAGYTVAAQSLSIGRLDTGSWPFGGDIDEVRISETVRSADWIKTTHNNQNSPGTYITAGSRQTVPGGVSSVPWYNRSWQQRQRVVIENDMVANTDQANFPVLISIAEANDLFDQAQADGDDILFTSSNGTTKLSHELEMHDVATTQMLAWVKIPTLSAGQNTVLYMYYGNASAADQQDAAGVWDTEYKVVLHLNETGTLTRADSTQYGNDGAVTGFASGNFEGDEREVCKIAGGVHLGGPTEYDYIDCGNDSSLDITNLVTVEAWINTDTLDGTYRAVLAKYWRYMLLKFNNTKLRFEAAGPEYVLASNRWYHAVATYDGSAGGNNRKLYVDGVLVDEDAGADWDTTTQDLTVGTTAYTDSGNSFDGKVDEVRVAKTARNADWIKTTYNNQSTPGQFLSFGAPEDPPPPPGTLIMIR